MVQAGEARVTVASIATRAVTRVVVTVVVVAAAKRRRRQR